MKTRFVPFVAGFLASMLLTGCIGLQIGGGEKRSSQSATIGQQLIDLKTAKDSGAMTESEYQEQRARLLRAK